MKAEWYKLGEGRRVPSAGQGVSAQVGVGCSRDPLVLGNRGHRPLSHHRGIAHYWG